MSKDDALQPIRNLQDRLKEIAASLNLDIEQFVYSPAGPNKPDTFHVSAVIRAEAVMSDAEKEQRNIDKQFEEMEKAFLEEDLLENRMPDIQKSVESWLVGIETEDEDDDSDDDS